MPKIDYRKYKAEFLYYLKISIFILIILILLYLLERFILYNTHNLLFSLIIPKSISIIPIKLISIISLICLHVLIARIVILSIIFPQGGIFKYILAYYEFSNFIHSFQSSKYFNRSSKEDIKDYITKLEKFKIAYNKIKSKLKSFEIKNHEIEAELNEVFDKYNKYICNDQLKIKNDLINSVEQFSKKLEYYRSFNYFQIYFIFKYTESLLLMEEFMMNNFENHFVDKINIGKDFDIYFLSPKEKNENKILAVYCNPNNMCSEFYAIEQDSLELYLEELNSAIILWDYYGYGLRAGFTTFAQIDKDVDILSKYIRNNYNDYKIIVHGYSIGGYSSIKLCQRFENKLLVSDRTFGDIDKIAGTLDYFYLGKLLKLIYNILFPKFIIHSDNVDDYISLSKDKKIIFFDEYDELISYNPASLVFNITKKYYNEIIKQKLFKFQEYKNLIKQPNNIENDLKELLIKFKSKHFDEKFKSFIYLLHKDINSFEEFFMFFIIFGYPFNQYKEINFDDDKFNKIYLDIPKLFFNFVNKYKNELSNKIIDLIKILNFLFIKCNLKSEISDNDIIKMNYMKNDGKPFELNETTLNELHKYFGFVHRVYCGHNGDLDSGDFKFINDFLIKNKIV